MTDAPDGSLSGPDPAVTPLLRDIRSRRMFLAEPVVERDLALLLEAGRWAPSTWNAQPWRFVVVRQSNQERFDAVVDALSVSNQRWAAHAPVLIVVAACAVFDDGNPNRHAAHDVGIASAFMAVQAASLGLHLQSMAGICPDAAAAAVNVPEDHEVMTVLAVGRVGPSSAVPRDVAQRDERPRLRKPITEIARDGAWDRHYTPGG